MMLIKCVIIIYFLIIFNRIYARNVVSETLVEDKIGENKSITANSPQALPTFVDITDKPNGNSKKGAIVIKDINITYHLSNCNKSIANINFKPEHWKQFVNIPKQDQAKFGNFNFGHKENNRDIKARVDKLIETSECTICRECLDKFRVLTKSKKKDKRSKKMISKLSKPKMIVKSGDRSDFEAIYGDPREMTNKREKREQIEKPKATHKIKSHHSKKPKKNRRSKKKYKTKNSTPDGVKEKHMETITSITKLKFENIKSEILQVNETERQVTTSKIKGVLDKVNNITHTCNLYQVTKLMSCDSPEASELQLESLRNTLQQAKKLDSKYSTSAKYESTINMPPKNGLTSAPTANIDRNYKSNLKANKIAID